MALSSIGDLAQQFVMRRNSAVLKERMNALTNELSTGQKSDLAAALGGDRMRLASADRDLRLIGSHKAAANGLSQMLSIMQTTLDQVDTLRSDLGNQLTAAISDSDVESGIVAAEDTFRAVVSALNVRVNDTSLFAGTTTDTNALPDAGDMLTALRGAVAGLTTVADVSNAVSGWMSANGYAGDTGDLMTRGIGDGTTVTIAARADDQSLQAILTSAAMAAVAGDADLDADAQHELVRTAGETLLGQGSALAALQGRLGQSEAQIETGLSHLSARETALGVIRNDLVAIDDYDVATQLQALQTQIETHYTLTARLGSLSLSEYLR